MDWNLSVGKKRHSSKKSGFHLGKSSSEPNLTDHFTPRFPNNLTKLLHEYLTVDELKFYRKRRPANAEDEIHSNFSLYDKTVTPIPFSALKTEYKKEFCKTYVRSRSVPKTIGNLNTTTNELIEALRDNDTDVIPIPEKSENRVRPVTAKISGDIELQANADVLASIMKPYAQVRKQISGDAQTQEHFSESMTNPDALNMNACTLKLEGELTYTPEYRSQYQQHQSIERSQSIPQMNNIKFHGSFHGIPEYQDNYKFYDNVAKREPLKRSDHLKLSPQFNAAIVSPLQMSEYSDRFKENNVESKTNAGAPIRKPFESSSIKKHLVSANQPQPMPEYLDKFKDPDIRGMPTLGKARAHNLSMDGNMEYKPEYRSNYLDFPRARPTTKRPETNMIFFEMPPSPGSVGSPPPTRAPILTNKYGARVAVIEPSKNIHHPTGLDADPSYLCQPEVRKARRELLIRKRPPSPSKTLAASIKSVDQVSLINEDEENKIYNAKSHIVSSETKPLPITVTVENFDDPKDKASTILTVNSPPKHGRRASVINNKISSKEPIKGYVQRQRNRAKIIEGNRDYFGTKKNSLSSTTTTTTMTDDEASDAAINASRNPTSTSFIILNEPCNENKWMKSSLLY